MKKITLPRRPKAEEFPVYVWVRAVTRAYGGPEEGDWYYDASIRHECVRQAYDDANFDAHVAAICEGYELKGSDIRMPSRWEGRNGIEYSLGFGTRVPKDVVRARPVYE